MLEPPRDRARNRQDCNGDNQANDHDPNVLLRSQREGIPGARVASRAA
jgi:hypothetical protein